MSWKVEHAHFSRLDSSLDCCFWSGFVFFVLLLLFDVCFVYLSIDLAYSILGLFSSIECVAVATHIFHVWSIGFFCLQKSIEFYCLWIIHIQSGYIVSHIIESLVRTKSVLQLNGSQTLAKQTLDSSQPCEPQINTEYCHKYATKRANSFKHTYASIRTVTALVGRQIWCEFCSWICI